MPAAAKKKKKSSIAFPIGLLVVVFAVVGLVTAVKWTVSTLSDNNINTAQKEEYEEFLAPVVMYDPDPFDDVSTADIPQLVNAAIWSLITDSGSTEVYSYSEGDNMGILIPKEDVNAEFIRLFGTEVDISEQYELIDMSAHDITYDAAQGGFIIPITSLDMAYTPEIYGIETKGSSVILSVGYIGSKAWAQIDDGTYTSPEPDKYMKITLRERDNDYYVASIQAVDAQEIASVAVTAPPAAPTTGVTEAPASEAQAVPQTEEDASAETESTEENTEEETEEETDEES